MSQTPYHLATQDPPRKLLHRTTKTKDVHENLKCAFGSGRKHGGEKGEHAGYQHFLLFPHNVLKGFFCPRAVKSRDRAVKG